MWNIYLASKLLPKKFKYVLGDHRVIASIILLFCTGCFREYSLQIVMFVPVCTATNGRLLRSSRLAVTPGISIKCLWYLFLVANRNRYRNRPKTFIEFSMFMVLYKFMHGLYLFSSGACRGRCRGKAGVLRRST